MEMERKLPEWMAKLKSTTKQINKENTDPSKEDILLEKPLLTFTGKIRYYNKVGDCGYVCEAILQKLETLEELVVGFDLEWPVQWVKGAGQGRTALIQFCPSTRVCYLFHVTEWKRLPKVFIDFISHPKVRLVGVNVRGDIWKLGRDFEVSVTPIVEHNTVELRHLANKVLCTQEGWSLDKIVLYVLKKQLDKSEVRTSNWAQERLTRHQVGYAATDAYASLLVYQRLKEIEAEVYRDNAAASQRLELRPPTLQKGAHNSEHGSKPY